MSDHDVKPYGYDINLDLNKRPSTYESDKSCRYINNGVYSTAVAVLTFLQMWYMR